MKVDLNGTEQVHGDNKDIILSGENLDLGSQALDQLRRAQIIAKAALPGKAINERIAGSIAKIYGTHNLDSCLKQVEQYYATNRQEATPT